MKLYYIIVSSCTAVKENRFSGLFLPEKHDKLIKKRETRTSRMRISRLLVCLCLLALLCACAAPAAALPETPAEATAAPEPVPTEPPVPAEPVEVPVAAEEPEPEAAVLPAEPVWVLGRLTDVYSTRESEWIRAEDVPEDAPMQTLNEVFTGEETLWAAVADILESAAPLQPEPGILDDLESISFGGQDYVKLEDVAARLGLEWGLAPDGSRYLAKRQTVGEIPEGWNVPVLMYHAVGDEIWGYSDLFVSAASMEEQLQYLQENGYEAIWFSDLAHIEDYEKPVILTFDDGHEDNYSELFPLLKKYNVKATLFVVTDFMSYVDICMNSEQVAELAQSGLVSIQSHTVTHPRLDMSTAESQEEEMRQSKLELTRVTGKEPFVLSYPYGKCSIDTRPLMGEYYRFGVKMSGRVYVTGDDPVLIYRYYVPRGLGVEAFAQMASGKG